MLKLTKKKIFQFQSLLKTSPNLDQFKGIPKSKNYMSGVSRNFKVNETKKKNPMFILMKEMLHKDLLLGSSLLCSSLNPKKGSVTIFPLIVSCCRSTSFLNIKEKNKIHARSMMSKRVVARAINSLHNVPHTNIVQYATHRVCAPEPNPIDPQAIKNNPYIPKKNKFIRHAEIRRQECVDDTECKEKSCPTLCSPPKGHEKVTGHLTHGTPNNPHGTTHKLSDTDAQGLPKKQFLVCYGNPHDATLAAIENLQATSYINQSHIANKIVTHEDKK